MNNNIICILFLIFACILILLYTFFLVKKEGLRSVVIKLIVGVEKMMGNGRGRDKMDFVIDKLTEILPFPISVFVTAEMLEIFIQKVFDEIKDALEYQSK